jgi:adenylate cyclase
MQVTVFFSDMRGFSGLSERLTPAELSDLVNRHYFTPLDGIIFAHNGTLDKHIGDSVMAIFGAPVSEGGDAVRAVQAALNILEEIGRININTPQADRRIAVGIGIATGEVLAGIFGSSWKKEYTAYGATVNLAKRLEKLAKADQIVVCDRTARQVEHLVHLEKIAEPIMKGVSRPSEVFRVIGRRNSA